MVGMANNRGGQIIFGVKNRPHIPIGLTNNKFQEFDIAKLNQIISMYFSHEISWELKTLQVEGSKLKQMNLFSEFLSFGQITVYESKKKPIICKKSFNDVLREGAVYYRYRGETKEVDYEEFDEMLKIEKQKERYLWMQLVNKISEIGPQNILLLDSFKGEIHIGNTKVLIDNWLFDKLKTIINNEGTDIDENVALKLIGTISGLPDKNTAIPSDITYPYRTANLLSELAINQFEFQSLIWKLNIKGNRKYHEAIKMSKNTTVHNYSIAFLKKIKDLIKKYPDFVGNCKEEYTEFNRRSKV
jgi:hypothetical protein